MGDFITVRHSFNSGDLLTSLPGFQKIYKETGKKAIIYQRLNLPADYGHADYHPIKDDNGIPVCMNSGQFNLLKPLIEYQEYVHCMQEWQGEEADFDLDKTRQDSRMPLPGGSIHAWASLIFPQLETDLSNSWVSVPPINWPLLRKIELASIIPEMKWEDVIKIFDQTGVMLYREKIVHDILPFQCVDKIIINRTARYQNPYINFFFLQSWQDKLVFSGTRTEYDSFCKEWNLPYVPYLVVNDFLELAQALHTCKVFIGNQSMCWHIADAMKVPRILEVCSSYPNTFPTGANGHSFITQQALEYQFNKLLNKIND